MRIPSLTGMLRLARQYVPAHPWTSMSDPGERKCPAGPRPSGPSSKDSPSESATQRPLTVSMSMSQRKLDECAVMSDGERCAVPSDRLAALCNVTGLPRDAALEQLQGNPAGVPESSRLTAEQQDALLELSSKPARDRSMHMLRKAGCLHSSVHVVSVQLERSMRPPVAVELVLDSKIPERVVEALRAAKLPAALEKQVRANAHLFDVDKGRPLVLYLPSEMGSYTIELALRDEGVALCALDGVPFMRAFGSDRGIRMWFAHGFSSDLDALVTEQISRETLSPRSHCSDSRCSDPFTRLVNKTYSRITDGTAHKPSTFLSGGGDLSYSDVSGQTLVWPLQAPGRLGECIVAYGAEIWFRRQFHAHQSKNELVALLGDAGISGLDPDRCKELPAIQDRDFDFQRRIRLNDASGI